MLDGDGVENKSLAKRKHRTSDQALQRGILADLRRVVASGYSVTPKQRDLWMQYAQEIASDPSSTKTERINALKLLGSFDAENTNKLALADKLDRLDHGDATENVEVKIRFSGRDSSGDATGCAPRLNG